jgi:hypothetical protein
LTFLAGLLLVLTSVTDGVAANKSGSNTHPLSFTRACRRRAV